jgi:predicted acetyltransferase
LSLIFRPGRPDDVPAAAPIASHSFPNVGLSPGEWESRLSDSPHGGVETLWVGEQEGRLVAACRLYRFEQYVGGTALATMGLGTVAISPTHRRRGLARQLVAAGFREARERGDVASALYPFRTSFYRDLGYGMAGEVHQFGFPPRALPDDPGRERVRLVESDEDRAEVAGLYARWAPHQTGQLRRTDRAWEPVWQQGTRHGVVYRDEAGRAGGYLIFRYHGDAQRGGRVVEVEEIAWTERAARLALYGWLASLSDQWDTILYRAHPEEAFPEHLSELRHPLEGVPRWHFWFAPAAVTYGPMFRLLDVAKAWSLRAAQPEASATVALEVHDPQIAENSGPLVLRMEGGRIEVLERQPSAVDVRVHIGIEALSRLFIGALSPTAALLAGAARVDRPELIPRLEYLLRVPRPWTFDRF